eukprot:scaffold3393_cov101-Isochrysis_galbana.AAC.8
MDVCVGWAGGAAAVWEGLRLRAACLYAHALLVGVRACVRVCERLSEKGGARGDVLVGRLKGARWREAAVAVCWSMGAGDVTAGLCWACAGGGWGGGGRGGCSCLNRSKLQKGGPREEGVVLGPSLQVVDGPPHTVKGRQLPIREWHHPVWQQQRRPRRQHMAQQPEQARAQPVGSTGQPPATAGRPSPRNDVAVDQRLVLAWPRREACDASTDGQGAKAIVSRHPGVIAGGAAFGGAGSSVAMSRGAISGGAIFVEAICSRASSGRATSGWAISGGRRREVAGHTISVLPQHALGSVPQCLDRF